MTQVFVSFLDTQQMAYIDNRHYIGQDITLNSPTEPEMEQFIDHTIQVGANRFEKIFVTRRGITKINLPDIVLFSDVISFTGFRDKHYYPFSSNTGYSNIGYEPYTSIFSVLINDVMYAPGESWVTNFQ